MALIDWKHASDGTRYTIIESLDALYWAEMSILHMTEVTLELKGKNISRHGKLSYVAIGTRTTQPLVPASTASRDVYLIDFRPTEDVTFIEEARDFIRELCASQTILKIVYNAKRLADCLKYLVHAFLHHVFDISCYDKLERGKLRQQLGFVELKSNWGVSPDIRFIPDVEHVGYWLASLDTARVDSVCGYLLILYLIYANMKKALSESRPLSVATADEQPLDFLMRLNNDRFIANGQLFFTTRDVIFMSQMNADYLVGCPFTRTIVIKNSRDRASLIGKKQKKLSRYEKVYRCRILPISTGLIIFSSCQTGVNSALTSLLKLVDPRRRH